MMAGSAQFPVAALLLAIWAGAAQAQPTLKPPAQPTLKPPAQPTLPAQATSPVTPLLGLGQPAVPAVADPLVFPPVRGLPFDAPPHGLPDQKALKPDRGDEMRLAVVPAALRYLGTPYRYGGFGSDGIDCSGLAFQALAAAAPELGPFPRSSPGYARFGVAVEGLPEPGDLLVFAREGVIYHVGIALSGDRFIHAASEGDRTGVIISSLREGHWKSRLVAVRRLGPFPEIKHASVRQ